MTTLKHLYGQIGKKQAGGRTLADCRRKADEIGRSDSPNKPVAVFVSWFKKAEKAGSSQSKPNKPRYGKPGGPDDPV